MDRTRRPTLVDRLLARPGRESPWTTLLHVVLILTWPLGLFFMLAGITRNVELNAQQFWMARGFSVFTRVTTEFELPEAREDGLLALMIVLCASLLLLTFGLLDHQLAARREPRSLRTFLRRTWRAALVTLVATPSLVYILMILPPPVSATVLPLTLFAPIGAYLFGPAIVAIFERRRRRISRERPACPECGYSLQHMVGVRCPECGESHPTTHRTYRRWACHRLRWDRSDRGALPAALPATVVRVLVRPALAGASVCVADRFGRAIRWAVACVLLVCILGAFTRSTMDLGFKLHSWLFVQTQSPQPPTEDGPSVARRLLWHAQCLIAWIVVVCAYPLIALFLIGLLPGIGRAARRTLVKWTLYSAAAIPVGYLFALAVDVVFLPQSPWFARSGYSNLLYFPYFVSRPPEMFVALVFGWVWAAGVSANRWIKWRGCETRLIAFAAYVLAWHFVAAFAFRPGALMRLL